MSPTRPRSTGARIMQADDVGVPWQPLVPGKHSGRHAVQKRLSDLGLSVDAERMVAVYRALMDIADERKIISDEDLVTVVKTENEEAWVLPGATQGWSPHSRVRRRHHAGGG